MSGHPDGTRRAHGTTLPAVTHGDRGDRLPGERSATDPTAGDPVAAPRAAGEPTGDEPRTAPPPQAGPQDPARGATSGPARAEARGEEAADGTAATTPGRVDYLAAFETAPAAMAVLDSSGAVVTANRAFGELVGVRPQDLASVDAAELIGLDTGGAARRSYLEVLAGRGDRMRRTRRVRRPDGRALWLEVVVATLPGGRALVCLADVSDRQDLLARLRHRQMHDPVTHLPNRALFFERLTAALETAALDQDGTGRVGLCYLDLDGFKAVNDTLGHHVGDRLLSAVAQRLTSLAAEPAGAEGPGGHLVARLGGDEYALLVEDSSGTEQVTDLAQRLLDALQQPFDLAGHRLSVSASIGVVERSAEGTTATALMQAADTTLYWAKEDGKARWTLFDPERNAHRMTRQALSSTLRPAVERGEFTLEYQPLVHLGDGRPHGVEALVRWRHPQFGKLPPNRFVPLAEENGAIVELGRWVLNEACRQARRWQLARPGRDPLFVSVNVAVRQVWDSDLVSDVAAILAETGLPPHLLQLELTESAVMGSAGRPLQALQELSDMGVLIAIDDFGTGYSNLAYLSRLPVSVLKLDGSFVRGFRSPEHPSPADETIVEALVTLAHRLGLTVTAECVESVEQAERLRRIGCDTGQGWLYSRPVAPERITELVDGGARRAAPGPGPGPAR